MAAEYLSAGIKICVTILKFVPHFVCTLWNYWTRPNLNFSVINSHIEFDRGDSKKLLPHFPSIRIQNADSTDVVLDLDSIIINGESLTFIVQQNIYFSMTHESTVKEKRLTTENIILKTFRENWTSSKNIKLPAHENIDIPIYPQNLGDSFYFNTYSNAKVFFPKRKIVVVITANSKESHFAVNRMSFLKSIVNNLVHTKG